MLLLSDGIVEAMNAAGELWGFERLETVFAEHGGRPPHEVVDALLDAVRAFIAGAPQHDDMTLVAIQAGGEERAAEGGCSSPRARSQAHPPPAS